MDFAPPGIAVLARLRLEQPDFFKDKERFSIFVDGGVRRGTDILKAVALGANGCAAGRPMLYANASYGAPGIHHAAKSQCPPPSIVLNHTLLTDLHVSAFNQSWGTR